MSGSGLRPEMERMSSDQAVEEPGVDVLPAHPPHKGLIGAVAQNLGCLSTRKHKQQVGRRVQQAAAVIGMRTVNRVACLRRVRVVVLVWREVVHNVPEAPLHTAQQPTYEVRREFRSTSVGTGVHDAQQTKVE